MRLFITIVIVNLVTKNEIFQIGIHKAIEIFQDWN